VKAKDSLNYQFKKQLAISIGLLVVVFAFLLHQLFFIGISTTMHRTMASMAKHYAEQIEQNKNYLLPTSGDYRAYIGIQNIPKKILDRFHHELDKNNNHKMLISEGDPTSLFGPPEQVHFLISQPLNDSKEKLYLIFSDSPQNKLNPPKKPGLLLNVPISIILITLLAIALIYWVARRLINRVLKPLNELSDMANSLDENQPELSFDIMNDNTEIGQVAITLHQTMGRIHQYHQREKQFLQNASHELRTPIAVVTSALDIIDLRAAQQNTDIADQHTHIRRANKDMAQITEALLLLSRKKSDQINVENVDLSQLILSSIEEHKYLLDHSLEKYTGEEITVEFNKRLNDLDKENHPHLLPKALCQITLNNLIRNAFEHTIQGTINICLDETRVTITNTGTGLSDKFQQESLRGLSRGQGFGIGLDIVRQIAEQQDWQLDVSSGQAGNQVILWFCENHQAT